MVPMEIPMAACTGLNIMTLSISRKLLFQEAPKAISRISISLLCASALYLMEKLIQVCLLQAWMVRR